MAESWETVKADQVRTGDAVRTHSGDVINVTRIDAAFMGMPTMLALVEDSDERWYKHPVMADGDVEIRSR
jgi:hypothetical protein